MNVKAEQQSKRLKKSSSSQTERVYAKLKKQW
jgi:hypothetical protein